MNPVLLKIFTSKYTYIGLGVLIILLFVIPKIKKGLAAAGSKLTDEGRDQSTSSVQADNELKNLAKKGITPSMKPGDFRLKAEALHAALDGCGTDDAQVLRIFGSMKNEADIYALIDAYGQRRISCMGFGSTSGLAAHLQEVSDDTKQKLNLAARSKGWTFRI